MVAFSRRDVLMLRDQIAAAGHPVSVIYGALPPEVRRREAERFAEGASHILVATDAIGMGLNLPIRRVLFSTMNKFDGVGDRPLGESRGAPDRRPRRALRHPRRRLRRRAEGGRALGRCAR